MPSDSWEQSATRARRPSASYSSRVHAPAKCWDGRTKLPRTTTTNVLDQYAPPTAQERFMTPEDIEFEDILRYEPELIFGSDCEFPTTLTQPKQEMSCNIDPLFGSQSATIAALQEWRCRDGVPEGCQSGNTGNYPAVAAGRGPPPYRIGDRCIPEHSPQAPQRFGSGGNFPQRATPILRTRSAGWQPWARRDC